MCQCSGTPREELFSKKYNPDGTKKGIGRPVGSQGVKVKAKPSVFVAAPRASSLAAIPKMRKGASNLRAAAKDSGDDARDDDACFCSESDGAGEDGSKVRSPGGEWGDFEKSFRAVKKYYRNLCFQGQNKRPQSARGQAAAQLQKGETFPKGAPQPCWTSELARETKRNGPKF